MGEDEGSESEFEDWEVLHDDTFAQVYSSGFSDSNSRCFQVVEGHPNPGSTIWLDYFSLRNPETYTKTALESTVSKECFIKSENLNSRDTDSENRTCRKNLSELKSELGDEFKQSHVNDLADATQSVVTGFEEITTDADNLERRESDGGKMSGSAFVCRDELFSAKDMYGTMESRESGEERESQDEIPDESYCNWSGNEWATMDSRDTDLENRNSRKNLSELKSESGDEFKQSHVNDLAVATESVTGFEEITTDADNLERRESDGGKLSGSAFVCRDELLSAKDMCSPMESGESGEESESRDEVPDESCFNWSGNERVTMKSGDDGKEVTGNDHIDSVNISNEELGVGDGDGDGDSSENTSVAVEEVKPEGKSGKVDDEAQRRVVWWKVPFQVLKYCFSKANPAWSFSVAAAFMGIVILGRRLYKMKRKTRNLQLKIAVDDKKVSQFADRAARLNEAFSVVRRVPVVRAPLTGAGVGVNSWPAMSMR